MSKFVRSLRPLGHAAKLVGLLVLVGCDQPTSAPTAPPVVPLASPVAVPVLPPNAAKEDLAPKAADGVRRPAQASDAKPMPGQNNDHSAPLAPDK